MEIISDIGVKNLTIAILSQSVDDYISYVHKYNKEKAKFIKTGKREHYNEMQLIRFSMDEIERFFEENADSYTRFLNMSTSKKNYMDICTLCREEIKEYA